VVDGTGEVVVLSLVASALVEAWRLWREGEKFHSACANDRSVPRGSPPVVVLHYTDGCGLESFVASVVEVVNVVCLHPGQLWLAHVVV
jgi:hypothetical protein